MAPDRTPTARPPISSHPRVPACPLLTRLTPAVHTILETPVMHGLIDSRICELCFPSPSTGRPVRMATKYARTSDDVVVLVSHADGVRWWHAFGRPYPARVLMHRQWRQGLGCAVSTGRPGWQQAHDVYTRRFGHSVVKGADIFVVISLRPRRLNA
ncbi:hypothetical protein [Actinoplanes sp. NPDC049316]|uniref:hypothetical protein n=1 Tax=Actinoplanes sp. NPDC049316 TaxID=3154727 RepID=UPI00344A0BE2